METKKLWYAVSRRGQGVIFTTYPVRNEKIGVFEGRIEACFCSVVSDMEAEGLIRLPDINFSDEPVELELTINVKC